LAKGSQESFRIIDWRVIFRFPYNKKNKKVRLLEYHQNRRLIANTLRRALGGRSCRQLRIVNLDEQEVKAYESDMATREAYLKSLTKHLDEGLGFSGERLRLLGEDALENADEDFSISGHVIQRVERLTVNLKALLDPGT